MTTFPYQHSFASQRLAENGIKIFQGRKRILLPPPQKIFEGILKTEITVGAKLTSKETSIKVLDYPDVIRMGFIVAERKARVKRFRGQKVEYYLAMATYANDYGCIPLDHRVEFDDINKKIRLLGANTDGRWIFLNVPVKEQIKALPDRGFYEEYLKSIMPEMEREEEEIKIEVPEIAVIIANDGRLICLRENQDNIILCLAGSKRKGKTLLKGRIMGQVYHKWRKPTINLNDPQQESASYCLTWGDYKWNELIKLKSIGEISVPMPMVYLHPKTSTLNQYVHKDEVGFEISLPFKECMINYDNMFKGTQKELGKSGEYLKKLIFDEKGNVRKDGMISKTTFQQQSDWIDKNIMDKMDLTREKLKTIFRDFSSQQIFDNMNGVPAKWKVVFPDGNEYEVYPWTACIMADLAPSVITSDLRNKSEFPQWIRFILQDIFQNQTANDYFKKNKIETFLQIDEAQRLFEIPIIHDSINAIARESGMSRISMQYVLQNITKVPEDLALVTDYVIAFNCNEEQATKLAKNFDMVSYHKKELTKLKPFHATLFPKIDYVWYDVYGNKGVSDEPVTGEIIPPNARHMPPKTMGVEE